MTTTRTPADGMVLDDVIALCRRLRLKYFREQSSDVLLTARAQRSMLTSLQSAPGHGVLPVHAFLLREDPAVLIDTGLPADRDECTGVLWSLVPPSELRMVFLTHEDADHAGNLGPVLDAAPEARLVTNYVTLSKLLERTTAPLERVRVVNPGDRVPDTARTLTVMRPPVYDAPGTLGLHDAVSGAAFTADAFGSYLPEGTGDIGAVRDEDLVAGLGTFNSVNHPGTALVDPHRFGAAVDAVADLEPTVLLSSHAPRPDRRLLCSSMRCDGPPRPLITSRPARRSSIGSNRC